MHTEHTPTDDYPRRTPWGHGDYAYAYPGGIKSVSTPSHGGFWVPAPLNRRIPGPLRNDRACNSAPTTTGGGWYEEDCEYAIVIMCLPDLFSDDDVAAARTTVKSWFPDEYEAAFPGEVVTEEESYKRAENNALARIRVDHADSWVSSAAFSDRVWWVPKGLVGVACTRGRDYRCNRNAEQTWWVVPAADYEKRLPTMGIVMDPARHGRLDAKPADTNSTDQDRIKWRLGGHGGVTLAQIDQADAGEPVTWDDRPTITYAYGATAAA